MGLSASKALPLPLPCGIRNGSQAGMARMGGSPCSARRQGAGGKENGALIALSVSIFKAWWEKENKASAIICSNNRSCDRCQSVLEQDRESSQDRTSKLSFQGKHRREKEESGALGHRFPSSEHSHCHVPHLRVPRWGSSRILIMPLLWAAVELGDKRTTGGLNHIFLFQ